MDAHIRTRTNGGADWLRNPIRLLAQIWIWRIQGGMPGRTAGGTPFSLPRPVLATGSSMRPQLGLLEHLSLAHLDSY